MITLVLAASVDGVIGNKGKLPWKLPNDMRHFIELTKNKTVVMGRKTWDSLPTCPLPNRTNIVLTREKNISFPGALTSNNYKEIIEYAKDKEVCIVGGAEIYKLFAPYADTIELTLVDGHIKGDCVIDYTIFEGFELINSTFNYRDARHMYNYMFITMKKISNNG